MDCECICHNEAGRCMECCDGGANVAALVKAARQLLSGPDGIYLADSIEALEDALKPFDD